MLINEIVTRFKGVKTDSNGYKCKCPAHADKEASLSISHSNGKTLISCHSGCSLESILDSVGLKITDLFDNAPEKKETQMFRSQKDLESYLMTITISSKKAVNYYKYTDEKGNLLYYKVRLQDKEGNKEFMFIRYINNKVVWGLSGGKKYETFENSNQYSGKEKPGARTIEIEEQPKELYNLKGLEYARKEGKTIFIVEGEKDVDTMSSIGLTAVSSPTGGGKGKEKWLERYSQLFKGCDVVILPDNDKPGLEFAEIVQKGLLKYCYKTRVCILSNMEKGDITDWYNSLSEEQKGEAASLIFDKIKLLKPKCPKWYKVTEKTKNVEDKIVVTGYDIELRKNYFAKYLLDTLDIVMIADNPMNRPVPHVYYNGVYEPRISIKSEIEPYLYIDNVTSNLLNEIEKLMLETVRHDVHFSDYLEGDDNIINFKNGLLNVITKEFKPHTPDYKSIVQIDCEYNPEAVTSGYWDKYINDLSEGKQDHKAVLQEMAGLVISNVAGYRVKKFLGLWGKGDTGKGKFWDILGRIIGSKAVGIISIQDLEKQFARVALYGKAFVYDGDLSKEGITDPAMLKKVTGGDNLKAEFKGKDVFNFKFTGVYAMACNDLPVLMGDYAEHMYNRIEILPCNNVIPVEKRNKFLVEDIINNDSQYVINWALEGLYRLIANNYEFTYCEDVEKTREHYKTVSDTVFAFISEKYEVTGEPKDRIPVSILRTEYASYCIEEGITKPVNKKKEFIKRCEAIKGLVFGKVKVDCIKGLKVKEFEEVDEESPFEDTNNIGEVTEEIEENEIAPWDRE